MMQNQIGIQYNPDREAYITKKRVKKTFQLPNTGKFNDIIENLGKKDPSTYIKEGIYNNFKTATGPLGLNKQHHPKQNFKQIYGSGSRPRSKYNTRAKMNLTQNQEILHTAPPLSAHELKHSQVNMNSTSFNRTWTRPGSHSGSRQQSHSKLRSRPVWKSPY